VAATNKQKQCLLTREAQKQCVAHRIYLVPSSRVSLALRRIAHEVRSPPSILQSKIPQQSEQELSDRR